MVYKIALGNSWGSENGQEGLGLGQQEEFYGCSDIAIQSSDIIPSSFVSSTTSRVTSLQSSTVNSQSTTGEEVVTESNPTTTTTTEVQFYPGKT